MFKPISKRIESEKYDKVEEHNSKTIFCYNCGEELDRRQLNYCHKCGTKI